MGSQVQADNQMLKHESRFLKRAPDTLQEDPHDPRKETRRHENRELFYPLPLSLLLEKGDLQ